MNEFSRTQMLIGEAALNKLASSRVAVFGVGGVGGYCVEALARSGVGELDLIDPDTVSLTNINRQLFATHSTLGRAKVDVAAERIRDINPACKVTTHKLFFLPETTELDFSRFDYVVDAIDTVAGKLALVRRALEANKPIICSMGAGNKLDPTAFRVSDIFETSVCPLARTMRRELRKMGISHLKVVWSTEPPLAPEPRTSLACEAQTSECDPNTSLACDARASECDPNTSLACEGEKPLGAGRRSTPGSISFVPPAAGLLLASEVIKSLIRDTGIQNG